MMRSVLVLDGDDAVTGSAGVAGTELRASFLHDSLELAARLPATRVRACSPEKLPAALAAALAEGPAIVLAADVPHLPIWRLRDAFTRLEHEADLVLGPDEEGGWYLLGLRPEAAPLIARIWPIERSLPALVARARADGLRLAGLPIWYRLARPADLKRLVDDLRPMPPTVAAHTRVTLLGDDLRSRAVGG